MSDCIGLRTNFISYVWKMACKELLLVLLTDSGI